MSALGQKQTSAHVRVMSALPPKVDIGTGHEQRETVFKLAAALTRQDQYLQPACAYRVIPEFGLPATQDGSHWLTSVWATITVAQSIVVIERVKPELMQATRRDMRKNYDCFATSWNTNSGYKIRRLADRNAH